MTLSRNEPATFRLVAQCLNQLRHQQRAHCLYNDSNNYINCLLGSLSDRINVCVLKYKIHFFDPCQASGLSETICWW